MKLNPHVNPPLTGRGWEGEGREGSNHLDAVQRMDYREQGRQLDHSWVVQERDGDAWTRLMAMNIGEIDRFQECLVWADLGERP